MIKIFKIEFTDEAMPLIKSPPRDCIVSPRDVSDCRMVLPSSKSAGKRVVKNFQKLWAISGAALNKAIACSISKGMISKAPIMKINIVTRVIIEVAISLERPSCSNLSAKGSRQ